MSTFGIYLIKEEKFGKTTLIFTFIKTIYGRNVYIECKNKRNARRAEIYTNTNNPKKFGVRLQEYLSYGNRWRGGNCIGFNFSYRKAREKAIDFVINNRY